MRLYPEPIVTEGKIINKYKMEIQIEFGGFYGYHEEYIDNRIDDYEIDFDNVDWNATFKDYAENWLWRFNNRSNLDLDFVGIVSSTYYNYRTDKIIAKVNYDNINELMCLV